LDEIHAWMCIQRSVPSSQAEQRASAIAAMRPGRVASVLSKAVSFNTALVKAFIVASA
jgi:hypothetical protein